VEHSKLLEFLNAAQTQIFIVQVTSHYKLFAHDLMNTGTAVAGTAESLNSCGRKLYIQVKNSYS
jgi:hypothetical protein